MSCMVLPWSLKASTLTPDVPVNPYPPLSLNRLLFLLNNLDIWICGRTITIHTRKMWCPKTLETQILTLLFDKYSLLFCPFMYSSLHLSYLPRQIWNMPQSSHCFDICSARSRTGCDSNMCRPHICWHINCLPLWFALINCDWIPQLKLLQANKYQIVLRQCGQTANYFLLQSKQSHLSNTSRYITVARI